MKIIKAFFALFLFTCNFIHAQEATLSSGSEINGSGGTISQSIGQVAYITASDNSITVSQGVQQTYIVSVETGINEKRISLELNAYPNPTSGKITLTTGNMDISDLHYSILDLTGRKLKEDEVRASSTIIDFDSFDNGTYFISVHRNNEQIKFFKLTQTL